MHIQDIQTPQDIKNLSVTELEILAEEIRSTIIGQVSKHGGHVASSLGVVELTLALHQVYNLPEDVIELFKSL